MLFIKKPSELNDGDIAELTKILNKTLQSTCLKEEARNSREHAKNRKHVVEQWKDVVELLFGKGDLEPMDIFNLGILTQVLRQASPVNYHICFEAIFVERIKALPRVTGNVRVVCDNGLISNNGI